MARTGRPRVPIDFNQLDKLLELHLSLEDVANFFDCSVDSIKRAVKREKKKTFALYSQQKSLKGKMLLMDRFWDGVKKGNTSLIIFGLKNRCGWHDNIQNTIAPRGFAFTKKRK